MTIELWDWLEHLSAIVGTDFPGADEDALWRCSRAWADAASELRALVPFSASTGDAVLAAIGGDAGDAFARLWDLFRDDHGYIWQLADQCDKLAEACDRTASDVEYAKLEYIAALAPLAVTLAWFVASAWTGVSALGMPAAIAFAQFTIRLILTRLISSILIGVGFVAGMDAVIQGIQFADGHRHEWDWSKTLRAVEDGAIYGAVGGAGFLGLGRLASPNLGVRAGLAAMTGVGGATGLVGGTLAPLAHGERPTSTDIGKATVASLIGGVSSARHGKGVASGPAGSEIADAHTVAAISDATLHLDGLTQPGAAGHEARPVGHHELDRTPTDRANVGDAAPVHRVIAHVDPAADLAGRASADRVTSDRVTADRVTTDRVVADRVTADRVTTDRVTADRPATGSAASGPTLAPDRAAVGRAPAPHDHLPAGAPRPGSPIGGDAVAPDQPRPAAVDNSATVAGHASAGSVARLDGSPGTSDAIDPGTRAGSFGGQTRGEALPPQSDGGLVAAVGIGRVDAHPDPGVTWDPRPWDPRPWESSPPPGQADRPESMAGNPAAVWSARGSHDPASPGWHDDSVGEADRGIAHLLDRARAAEPALTEIVRGVADRVGGELAGLGERLKAAASTSDKLARYLRAHPSETFVQGLAEITDTLRYTIVFPDESYATRAQAAIDELIGSSLDPVRDRRSWDNSAGYLGVNTVWFDEATGHTFELQLHTAASYTAKSVTHAMYEVLRTSDVELPELQAQHDGHFAVVHVPDGALNVGIPDSLPRHPPTFEMPDDMRSRSADPYQSHGPDSDTPHHDGATSLTSGVDGPPPDPRHPVTDTEAVALVRRHVVETDAGLAFYPVRDEMRDFARAMRPTDGLLTLDLHGSRSGFQVGHGLLTPEQLALGLRELREAAVLDLPVGTGIKLISCDTAFGGEHSPAARLARALGVEVVAPDEPVWTTIDGLELVSSPSLFLGNLLPTFPPDGAWHRFAPTGREIPLGQDPVGRRWSEDGPGPARHPMPRERLSGLDPPP